MQNNIINVTTLNTVINSIFRAEEHLHDIQVAGEVSGFKIFKGHGYFILKDDKSQINCNCFNCAKTYQPKDGESVILKGSVDYYTAGGRLNFNVDSIKPIGKGLLALKLEMLKAKLAEEGYFDSCHKKPIPKFPSRVCVVTSFNGAVIKDICKTIRAKNNIIDIVVKDVKVQGKDAHIDISNAIEQVDKLGFDVIIIARGGGSAEELMPFNEELLIKTIFRAKTPIISAVGHQTDFTLCDEVADLRVATPTAAGEVVGFDVNQLKEYIIGLSSKIRLSLNNKLDNYSNTLNHIKKLIASQMLLSTSRYESIVSNYSIRLRNCMSGIINNYDYMMMNYLTKLDAYNPANILKKGYWHIQKNDKTIFSTKQLSAGDDIKLHTHDGQVLAKVVEVKYEI